jgi:hypothetical protein
VTIEYGIGADGPTLRLAATPQGVALLQAVFRRLAAGGVMLQDGAGVRLSGIDGVELLHQGRDFRLRRVDGQPPGSCGVATRNGGGPGLTSWTR